MENTINAKTLGFVVLAFLLGGVCGYQYHAYSEEKSAKQFFGVASPTPSKQTQEFFDFKPENK